MILQLIIGKWRTPAHSRKKSEDDGHEVKKEILKAVSRGDGPKGYQHIVGRNPDIDVEDSMIVLKGVGRYRGKLYPTSIRAEDFLVLTVAYQERGVRIQLLVGETVRQVDSTTVLECSRASHSYLVPSDQRCIRVVCDHVLDSYRIAQPTAVLILVMEKHK